ncbi:MAG: ferrous iron transporter, partial [Nocardioides sp.]|nr:ferrous iron transporter [Nocardioides sp.]
AGVQTPSAHVSPTAQLADGRTATLHVSGRTATLVAGSDRLQLTDPRTHGDETTWKSPAAAGKHPGTLDAATLLTYTGNRVPVGMSIATAPGPYAARWAGDAATTVVTRDGGLADVRTDGQQVLTISGGGLTSPRTFTVGGSGWQIDDAYAAKVAARTSAADAAAHDRMLWKHWLPVALIITAGVLLWQSRRRGEGPAGPVAADNDPAPKDEQAPAVEGHTHVA